MTHHIPRLSIGPLNRIRRRLHHSIILGLTALTTATATTLCSTSAIPAARADALPNLPTNPIAKAPDTSTAAKNLRLLSKLLIIHPNQLRASKLFPPTPTPPKI